MPHAENASRASTTQKRTRIQKEKEEAILDAALNVFSTYGFRGATIDQIASLANLSKPNVLYYFNSKEAIHRQLIDRILEDWLEPLLAIDPNGNPVWELRAYIRQKLELARDYPRESRLFANEILQGAPHIAEELQDLKTLVDEKSVIIRDWAEAGKIKAVDPRHLFFAIWSTTQHYADFDAQIRVVLGLPEDGEDHFEEAARFLDMLFVDGLVVAQPETAAP